MLRSHSHAFIGLVYFVTFVKAMPPLRKIRNMYIQLSISSDVYYIVLREWIKAASIPTTSSLPS